MRKILKTLALIAIGVAVGQVSKNINFTVTDHENNLLVDYNGKDLIEHDSVKVDIN